MAAITAGDITVTISAVNVIGRTRQNQVTVAFSVTTLTYPAGGVPMPTYPTFGMLRQLNYLQIIDGSSATGVIWKWDFTNKTLRGYLTGGTHTHNLLIKGTTVTDNTNTIFIATGVVSQNNVTTDTTITSNATNGGVVAVTATAAVGTEIATGGVLAAATSIVGVAVGW